MKKKNIIIILITIFIDQISKIIINKTITINTSIKIINNFFYLTNAHNKGAAWSILEGNRLLLIIISLISIYYINKYIKDKEKIYINLLNAGIIGNLIDRIILGYVRDFLDFKIFNYNYPIFNIADICIFIGITLLIVEEVKESKNENRSRRYKQKNR